jgi:2-succinyl-6-hydroxy-2,4-cyclohexadiene-1-carboxylate synthase
VSRVVLVHGFTQTARSWDDLIPELSHDFEVVAVDAPGHGRASDVHADLVDGAARLAAAGGRATYVGYSMGGRLCLHAALDFPDAVHGLVLISATGGIDDVGEREARRAADEALADRIESIGVAAFVDEWLAQPLFASLPPAAQGRAERLHNTAAGLASSLRLAGTGTQAPLWDRLTDLRIPTLVVAGALDGKFVALGERLAATIPGADLAVVDGAGHTVHLERPDAFLALVLPWLAAHDPAPGADAPGRSGPSR